MHLFTCRMKIRTTALSILVLAFLALASLPKPLYADESAGPADPAAIETVSNYLAALVAGDTVRMRNYLAPDFLQERRPLLDNPSYPHLLQNTYANATYTIIGSGKTHEGSNWIDTRIELRNHEIVNTRILVSGSGGRYQVIGEN